MGLRTARILIVDDEPANTLLLERILAKEGYTDVRSLSDPRQVLGEIRASEPDLILLDLHMPHLDGTQVLAQIRDAFPKDTYLPVLVLSADRLQHARNSVLTSGAQDFLLKPFDRQEVLLRVRNLLETRFLHLDLRRHGQCLEEEVDLRTRELRRALQAAVEASRAKDQFLANMGHELRTPLTGLRGPLALVSGHYGGSLPEAGRRMLEVAIRASERLERALLDILRLMDVQSGSLALELRPVDLRELLDGLASEHAPRAARKGLDYACAVPRPLSPLQTDAAGLREVLDRLLHNAIRFTEQGTVALEVVPDVATGQAREIRVRDTGAGIDPAHHEAIFQPFEQVDNSDSRQHQGLGLGLAIARALCDRMGYTLLVRSRAGGGATFHVVLGAQPGPPAA